MKVTRYIALLSVLLAFTLAIALLEAFYMPDLFLPGMKLGLANVVILLTLYLFSVKDAAIISLLRVFIVSLISGTIFNMGFYMSLLGAVLSLLVMSLLKLVFKKKKASIITVSIAGSFFHIVGQIIIAVIFTVDSIVFYFPLIALTSIGAGFLIGLIVHYLLKNKTLIHYVNKYYKYQGKTPKFSEAVPSNVTNKSDTNGEIGNQTEEPIKEEAEIKEDTKSEELKE